MKIGEKLYCHNPCIMNNGEKTTTEGRCYNIVEVTTTRIMIKDDNNYDHYFLIKKGEDCYINWFTNIKLERKKKLKKLKKSFEL